MVAELLNDPSDQDGQASQSSVKREGRRNISLSAEIIFGEIRKQIQRGKEWVEVTLQSSAELGLPIDLPIQKASSMIC